MIQLSFQSFVRLTDIFLFMIAIYNCICTDIALGNPLRIASCDQFAFSIWKCVIWIDKKNIIWFYTSQWIPLKMIFFIRILIFIVMARSNFVFSFTLFLFLLKFPTYMWNYYIHSTCLIIIIELRLQFTISCHCFRELWLFSTNIKSERIFFWW